jgi:hypothetical protein
MRLRQQTAAIAMMLFATPSVAGPADSGLPSPQVTPPATLAANETRPQEPDTDIFALMSGRCSTLRIAGRDFACRKVAFFHNENGRVNFTVALDDPADNSHVVAFSGEYGERPQQDLYELQIDRMLLSSKDRPKADGLPVPFVERSAGMCRQLGNFAMRQVSSISCSATDRAGRRYELEFVSDGLPITVRRVRQSKPSIRHHPFE